MNPNGNVGPNLLVRDPSTPTKDVYVEVRQFVEDYGETKRLKSAIKNGFLVLYGVRNKDAKKILDAVSGKQRQGSRLPADSSYVVALKSDKESIYDHEFDFAVELLDQEAAGGGGTYERIGPVLFFHGYTNRNTGKSWYLWENSRAPVDQRLSSNLADKLRVLSLPPPHERAFD